MNEPPILAIPPKRPRRIGGVVANLCWLAVFAALGTYAWHKWSQLKPLGRDLMSAELRCELSSECDELRTTCLALRRQVAGTNQQIASDGFLLVPREDELVAVIIPAHAHSARPAGHRIMLFVPGPSAVLHCHLWFGQKKARVSEVPLPCGKILELRFHVEHDRPSDSMNLMLESAGLPDSPINLGRLSSGLSTVEGLGTNAIEETAIRAPDDWTNATVQLGAMQPSPSFLPRLPGRRGTIWPAGIAARSEDAGTGLVWRLRLDDEAPSQLVLLKLFLDGQHPKCVDEFEREFHFALRSAPTDWISGIRQASNPLYIELPRDVESDSPVGVPQVPAPTQPLQ